MCLLAFQRMPRHNDVQDALDVHNAARAEVGVAPLTWDDTLAKERYAKELARRHRFEHDRDNNGHGEVRATTNTPMSDASKSW